MVQKQAAVHDTEHRPHRAGHTSARHAMHVKVHSAASSNPGVAPLLLLWRILLMRSAGPAGATHGLIKHLGASCMSP